MKRYALICVALALSILVACGGSPEVGSWAIEGTKLPTREEPPTLRLTKAGQIDATFVVRLAETYVLAPAGMYRGAEKEGGSSWLIYEGKNPCSVAVSQAGRDIQFAVTNVSVSPVYTNIQIARGQGQNRVFLAAPQCEAHESLPFSFSSTPAPQVTYRKQIFGILNLKAQYRFTGKESIEVYAVGAPQGSSEQVEIVLAKVQLADGRLILQSNGTFLVSDQSYTKLPTTRS